MKQHTVMKCQDSIYQTDSRNTRALLDPGQAARPVPDLSYLYMFSIQCKAFLSHISPRYRFELP